MMSSFRRGVDANCARLAASSDNSRYPVSINCACMQHWDSCTEYGSVRACESTNVRNVYLFNFSYMKSIFVQRRCIILNICLWA